MLSTAEAEMERRREPNTATRKVPLQYVPSKQNPDEFRQKARCPYCRAWNWLTFEDEKVNVCEHYKATDGTEILFVKILHGSPRFSVIDGRKFIDMDGMVVE